MGSDFRGNGYARPGKSRLKRLDLSARTKAAHDRICGLPPLTREEEADLAVKAAAGDTDAANEIAMHCMNMAVLWAASYAGRGASFDDLAGAAILACFEASRTFEPGRGRFSQYAANSIYWAIVRELQYRCGSLPRGRHEQSIKNGSNVVSLDDETAAAAKIADTLCSGDAPDAPYDDAETATKVRAAVEAMPPAYRDIIVRRWLYEGERPRLTDLAGEAGVCGSAMLYRERRALEELYIKHGKVLRDLLK